MNGHNGVGQQISLRQQVKRQPWRYQAWRRQAAWLSVLSKKHRKIEKRRAEKNNEKRISKNIALAAWQYQRKTAIARQLWRQTGIARHRVVIARIYRVRARHRGAVMRGRELGIDGLWYDGSSGGMSAARMAWLKVACSAACCLLCYLNTSQILRLKA